MLGLIWIQTAWHTDGIPQRFFLKKLIFKKSAGNESIQNYPVGKELSDHISS